MRIMGIDPGSRKTGYGILEIGDSQRFHVLGQGVIQPPPKAELSQRLRLIFETLSELFDLYEPEVLAVEEIFFAHDVKSALALGHVRGVILLAGSRKEVPIIPYSATRVKQAVSGSGRADKAQVQRMVFQRLSLKERPTADAADALALAICHAQSMRMRAHE